MELGKRHLKKKSKKLAPSISLRLDYEIAESIDKEVESEKFSNRTEAISYYIQKGQELEALIQISKDPEKKKEFESKFMSLLNAEDIERTLETCDIETLKLIRLITNDKIEKKFKQLVIQVKSAR